MRTSVHESDHGIGSGGAAAAHSETKTDEPSHSLYGPDDGQSRIVKDCQRPTEWQMTLESSHHRQYTVQALCAE